MTQQKPSDSLHKQAQREAQWLTLWQSRGRMTRALWPLSWLFERIATGRRVSFLRGWRAQYRMPVPVIVVGGIMIGGVGKTPIVAQMIQDLRRAGFQPAIITRGYGSQANQQRREVEVTAESLASEVGDEPLLLQRITGVPVWVGANRVDAARALCAAHPECDVIVCDDGLQHYRLYRDLEIAVLDDRGVGNGWCLPAGPLREPPARLNSVSAVIHHRRRSPSSSGRALSDMPWLPQPLNTPQFEVCSSLNSAYALAQVQRTIALNGWPYLFGAQEGEKALMLAGIAQPQVFFQMLNDWGIQGETLALPDHAPLDAALAKRLLQLMQEKACRAIFMTEKDAVKCLHWVQDFPELAEKIWVVPLKVQSNDGWQALVDYLIGQLNELTRNPQL